MALVEDLQQMKESGSKSLIFSQFTQMLDLIEVALKNARIKFTRLDGTMVHDKRYYNTLR